MEWSVYWKIAHEATNYLHDHNYVCTYNKFNHVQRENKEYTVGFLIFVSHDQYSTNIGEDTTIIVSINGESYKHFILFVVTKLITPQPLVRFSPQFRPWKDLLL
jgi:hypothetical protein